MTTRQANRERGREIRRALLAVTNVCIEKNKTLPTQEAIAKAIGIHRTQCCRHFRRLVLDGELVLIKKDRRNTLGGGF